MFNRISEQRRKRLQELEQRISALNKKITEQGKIIKMKEKNDEKITQLNNEIQVCLQTTHYFQNMLQFQGLEHIWLS
jgi:kinesin family protein 4/21/27